MNNLSNDFPAIDFLENDSQLVPNKPVVQSVSNDATSIQSDETLWKLKGQLDAYQKGSFMGKGDRSNILFQEFLKKLRKTIEEIVRDELKLKGHTSESFKDEFKALDSLFNIILNHLGHLQVEIKDERFIALLHGFINSYVESAIKPNN